MKIFRKSFSCRLISMIFIYISINKLVTASKELDCQIRRNATLKWETILSPGFPQKFPYNFHCQWRIRTFQGYRIKLQFTKFSLIDSNAKGLCRSQWLTVINPLDRRRKTSVKFCGKLKPGTYVSTGNSLVLFLQSVSSYETTDYSGFELTFVATLDLPRIPGKPLLTQKYQKLSNLNKKIGQRRINAGQKQSNQVENFNEKRNSGHRSQEFPNLINLELLHDADVNDFLTTAAASSNSDEFKENFSLPSLSTKNKVLLIVAGIGALFVSLWLVYIFSKKKHCKVFRSEIDKRNPKKSTKEQQKKEFLNNNCTVGERISIKEKKVNKEVNPRNEHSSSFHNTSEKIGFKTSNQQIVVKNREENFRMKNQKEVKKSYLKTPKKTLPENDKRQKSVKTYRTTEKAIPYSMHCNISTNNDLANLRSVITNKDLTKRYYETSRIKPQHKGFDHRR